MQEEITNVITSINVNDHDRYRVALYYYYIPINDLSAVVNFHARFKTKFGGRIRIAAEGLNGVLSGIISDLEDYEEQLRDLLLTLTSYNQSHEGGQSSSSIELDIKYCKLRTDLTVEAQLFKDWNVQITDWVVALMENPQVGPLVNETDENFESNHVTNENNKSRSNRKRMQQQQRRQNQMDNYERFQIQQYQQDIARDIYQKSIVSKVCSKQLVVGSPYLTPKEWNTKLEQLVQAQSTSTRNNIVLLDCRNCYESSVGYFKMPGTTTVLTNTRKFSELPIVLIDQMMNDKATVLQSATHIFMYCTGGVRCERASAYLEAVISNKQSILSNGDNNSSENANTNDMFKTQPEIYQLHGGIQRYLEFQNDHPEAVSNYYTGKNFVFDLRRTDPTTFSVSPVGQCLVCWKPHDDYDNGHAPITHHETRCYKCRILILVCNQCRINVLCWGDDDHSVKIGNTDTTSKIELLTISPEHNNLTLKPKLYCGGLEPKKCLYMPPVKELKG